MRKSAYEFSTDKRRFDVALIHDFLRNSYWAKDIPRQVVMRSLRHSLCFGVFYGKQQIGFARMITDRATMAYLADVFVVPEHRGRGVSKKLMAWILAHKDLQGLRRILLATKDAHGLYEQFGFKPLANPERFMTIATANVYQKEIPIKRARAKRITDGRERHDKFLTQRKTKLGQ